MARKDCLERIARGKECTCPEWELTDEEKLNLKSRNSYRNSYDLVEIRVHRLVSDVARMQAKKLVEWGNHPCEEHRVPNESVNKRFACWQCRAELKRQVGVELWN